MAPSALRWAEQSRYDLDTARAMQRSGRYLYVLFCCQQSAEKALKAVISEKTEQFPPRIHNLARLCELAGMALDPKKAEFLSELSAYYIQTRYPEDIDALARTEEIVEWLLSTLK
jgi:HEPN domain-containing protein